MKLLCVAATLALAACSASGQHRLGGPKDGTADARPWMDKSLSAEARSELVLKQMTLDEKLLLLHGNGMPGWGKPRANAYLGNGGAGFILGIERLGLPPIQMSDAAYGVRSSGENGRYSTALPSNVASASSWDTEGACAYGRLIGQELRAQGYNMTLGGGVNLTREPRNGRTFEYMGEDPVLAGTLVGNRIKCEQAEHVIGDIKHFALNDQESGRNNVDSIIDRRSLRETDLLAFQIGLKIGDPGAVMCSYNAINGDFACENKYLLKETLKQDWAFKGFVLSDWGGTHSTVKASAAGLDNEEPLDEFYGDSFKAAVLAGTISQAEFDDHVRRVLWGEFHSGIVDYPIRKSVVDVEANLVTARKLAEASMVLLKNDGAILPLAAGKVRTIAVIGSHADMGMMSGGGSAQVDPPGRPATKWQEHVWWPGAPLDAIRKLGSGIQVTFDDGSDPARAAAVAARADVAIVCAYQWTSEGMDLPTLALPDGQDKLIDAVASANRKTVVVLETGTAVTMPWIGKVAGVVEAWYAGSKGAEALANVLFGVVNPSAKLPMTFPVTEADLPHPLLVTPPRGAQGAAGVMKSGTAQPTFAVHYDEGLQVGYKWYDEQKKPVLFGFGYGLSYTRFQYEDLKVKVAGKSAVVSFRVKNAGAMAGSEIAEVYASLPAGAQEPPKRLVAWQKVPLAAGESRMIELTVDPQYLSVYGEAGGWHLPSGTYGVQVGGSSLDLPLKATVEMK